MYPAVETVYDTERGCGNRKEGGFYLRGGREMFSGCGKMPTPLNQICSHCGNSLVPTTTLKDGSVKFMLPRSLQKINAIEFFREVACKHDSARCNLCIINNLEGRSCYLIGVGEGHYKYPQDFIQEALSLNPVTGEGNGVSKRLAFIPKELVVGEDTPERKVSVIFLAHPVAIIDYKSGIESGDDGHAPLILGDDDGAEVLQSITKVPGVIAIFRPSKIEYVVRGDESDEYIESLMKRGISPVRVVRVDKQGHPLPEESEDVLEEAS